MSSSMIAATTPTPPQAIGGVQPTSFCHPLIENWADDSWPLSSRQASEIITEQVLQQSSSVPIVVPISFDDCHEAQACNSSVEQMTPQNSSSQGDTVCCETTATLVPSGVSSWACTTTPTSSFPNQSFGSAMLRAPSASSSPEDEETMKGGVDNNSATTAYVSAHHHHHKNHIRRSYTHDPYCAYTGVKLITVCTCPSCIPRNFSPLPSAGAEGWNNTSQAPTNKGEGEACGLASTDTSSSTAEQQFLDDYTATQKQFYAQQQPATMIFTSYPIINSRKPSTNTTSTKAATTATYPPEASSRLFSETPILTGGFTPYPCRLPPALLQSKTASTTLQLQVGGANDGMPLLPTEEGEAAGGVAFCAPPPPLGICMNNTSQTSFMPPAPPLLSRCQRIVSPEDGAATRSQTSEIMSAMLHRWYIRVVRNQKNFTETTTDCPPFVGPPSSSAAMQKWSAACHAWWTTHFSTMQLKYPPKQSGANKNKKKKKACAKKNKKLLSLKAKVCCCRC